MMSKGKEASPRTMARLSHESAVPIGINSTKERATNFSPSPLHATRETQGVNWHKVSLHSPMERYVYKLTCRRGN
jgi:hypothetical protein